MTAILELLMSVRLRSHWAPKAMSSRSPPPASPMSMFRKAAPYPVEPLKLGARTANPLCDRQCRMSVSPAQLSKTCAHGPPWA